MKFNIAHWTLVASLLSGASLAQAQEFKWQDGLSDEIFGAIIDLDAAAQAELTKTSPNSISVGQGDNVKLDTGLFETDPLSAPGAVDLSFSGAKFRIQLDGR